jgi:hypothetical protein
MTPFLSLPFSESLRRGEPQLWQTVFVFHMTTPNFLGKKAQQALILFLLPNIYFQGFAGGRGKSEGSKSRVE